EDVQRVGAVVLDQIQIGLPHVGADELDLLAELLANQGKELLEALGRSLLAHPEQALAARIDLVDQGQILVSAAVLDLIDADGADRIEASRLQAPLHDVLDSMEHLLPG